MKSSVEEPQVPWNQSIKIRFTLAVVLLIIVMILTVGFGLIYLASQEQIHSVYQYQKKTSEEISLIISDFFSDLTDHLSMYISGVHFSEMTIPKQKEALLELLTEKESVFQDFSVLTSEGAEIIKVSRFHTYLPDELQNKSDDTLFLSALSGKLIVSPIYYSPQSGMVSVDIAIPVSGKQGNISHIIIATASVVQLWFAVQQITVGDTGYIYIVDKNGHFIAYQKVSEILNHYGSSMEAYPPVRSFILGNSDDAKGISVYPGLNQEEVIGSYARISGTEWAVIAETPTQEAFSKLYQMVQITLIALLLGVLCAGLLGYLLSRHLVGPILTLTQAVSRIGQGDLNTAVIGIDRLDEVGVLARGISRMQHDLNQLYQNLEKKVVELKKTRGELQLSEEQYRTIFEHNENPLILVEDDMSIILINKKFEELWGYSRSEVIGIKKWTEFIATEENLKKMISINKRRKSGEQNVPSLYDFQFVNRSGEIKDIMISVTQMPGKKQTLATLIDVTDQKKTEREILQKNSDLNVAYEKLAANEKELRESYHKLAEYEKELRESELKYRSVVENQTDIISRFNKDGSIIFVNDAFSKFFKINKDDLLLRKISFPEIDEYKKEILEQISFIRPHHLVHNFEQKVIGPDEELHWFHQTIRGFYSEHYDFIEYQSVAREITGRKTAEEALEKARNKLSLLNAITFEDIRNYLFTLSGYLEVHKDMISDETALSIFDKEQTIVKKIAQSLEFAKDYQDMGIRPAGWQNALQVYLFAISHLDLSWIHRDENIKGIFIYADPLLEKVFFNLALNILIHGKKSVTELHLHADKKGEDLIIVFEDNGPGIPDDEKEFIFQRRSESKKGMGLYFVREVLGITGITIYEKGMYGKGARFEIIVPNGKYRYETDNSSEG